jgi:hypothetical protein
MSTNNPNSQHARVTDPVPLRPGADTELKTLFQSRCVPPSSRDCSPATARANAPLTANIPPVAGYLFILDTAGGQR